MVQGVQRVVHGVVQRGWSNGVVQRVTAVVSWSYAVGVQRVCRQCHWVARRCTTGGQVDRGAVIGPPSEAVAEGPLLG